MENQDLEQSILILSRTRRNLSASAPSESNGPNFLDKALAKQISVRQSELDLNLQRCGSVIVRASTPDPREKHHVVKIALKTTQFSRIMTQN